MIEALRGQRESISGLCGGADCVLELYHKAPMELDAACFGLDSAGRLSDEQYFVFYNQKQSPEQAVCLSAGAAAGSERFTLSLSKLPSKISKLSFAVSIDGTRTMRELEKGYVRLLSGQTETLRFSYSGAEFSGERAIVICEIYRKGDDWRFCAVGRGFNGGLKALIESYGGSVASPTPAQPAAAPVPAGAADAPAPPAEQAGGIRAGAPRRPANAAFQNVVRSLPAEVCTRMDNLARQCRGDTAYLSELYKNMFLMLARYPGAAERSVQVVMCSDISGSMFDQYRNGRMQRVVDKFFTYASTLSDAAAMDFWAFAAKSRQFGAVTMDNVRDYTFAEMGGFERWMSMLNYQFNNEPEAMRDIMMIYGGLRAPVMVLFVTDGHLSADWAIEEILIKTSRFPIYWQFIGIGGSEYGILSCLNEIDGRHSNNAAFLKLEDIDDLSDQALFQELLCNLEQWLNELSCKKMLEE